MTYLALTIGPIYKTLQNAKKPKELFASSYIFSYIMREIIEKFRDREFITPYINDKEIFKQNEIGLFHDRFIFVSKDGDKEKLSQVIDDLLNELASKLDIDFSSIKDYLQINFDEYDIKEDKNPLIELSPYLDSLELFYQVTQSDEFISKLRRKKGDRDNFLTDGKNIVDDLKKLSFNNYYCVVHADGDKMSKAIEDKSNIENVSKSLFEYCISSNQMIKNFGGQTIFAGGDDLLFFAPVVSRDKKETVFDLCDNIAKDFEEKIDSATLSFGITINYIKFPLYEALENSREMLFTKAKNEKRDNIAFLLTKHSGQSVEAIIHKGDKASYEKFLEFTRLAVDKESKLLHSIHHKLDTYKVVLDEIKNDKTKLKNFFENYFNEAGHDEYREFFDSLAGFISVSDIEKVYATLRFVKFVVGDKS